MEQGKISDIITNALKADRSNYVKNEKALISQFMKAVRLNLSLFNNTNAIDLTNNNGFRLDENEIDKILGRYEEVDSIIHHNDEIKIYNDQLMRTTLYEKLGIILVLFDGNTYTMLEMMLLGLLTHNTMIFMYDGYMLGSNGLLISLMETILKKENMDTHMFQQCYSIQSDIFENYQSIAKTVIIGNHDFVSRYIKECSTDVVVSGAYHYDMYIEKMIDSDLIHKILDLKLDVQLYVDDQGKDDFDDAIVVSDVEDAITQIRYNGNGFSTSIFTTDNDSASKFMREVQSSHIFVNTSPTVIRSVDIKQEDLLSERNLYIPKIYKMDGTSVKIDV